MSTVTWNSIGRETEWYISVKLSNKAGEVIVLEVFGQKVFSELGRIPDDEAVIRSTPRNNVIGSRIIHHIVSLDQEGRWSIDTGHRRRCRRWSSSTAIWCGCGSITITTSFHGDGCCVQFRDVIAPLTEFKNPRLKIVVEVWRNYGKRKWWLDL